MLLAGDAAAAVAVTILLLIFAPTQLCGDCIPGYVESVGSMECIPIKQCDGDIAIVWFAIAVGVFLSAVIQVTVISDLLRPRKSFPTGRFKLLLYFFQVRLVVLLSGHLRYAVT